MNQKTFLAATIAGGIVGNILDMVVQGSVLTGMYYSKLPQLFRQDMNLPLLIAGDFVAAGVLIWFYQVVLASFGTGLMNGLRFGIYAGIFATFPLWIFLHMMIVGFPYGLSWILTFYGIFWCAILGAVAGWIYEKMS